MTELITYIFEIIAMVTSFIVGLLLFKKAKGSGIPLATGFLSVGTIFLGLYCLATIIYSVIGQEWAIQVFLRLGMISILFALMLLFYAIEILIHSSSWIKGNKLYSIGPFLIALVVALVLIFSDYIEVLDPIAADTSFDLLPFLLYVILVVIVLAYTMISLYHYGIKQNTGEAKKRMELFFAGMVCFLLSMITDVIGNSFNELESLFDTLLFVFITIGVLLYTSTFILKFRSEAKE